MQKEIGPEENSRAIVCNDAPQNPAHVHSDETLRHVHAHSDESHSHEHVHSDETLRHVHAHSDESHSHEHVHSDESHSHDHNHPNAKAVSNRLARAIGHLESVKRMVDDGEDCAQILIQLAAVRSAINNAGKVLLSDHINHCMVEAVENKDYAKIDELNDAIQKFVK